jgi:hypothetical protein
MRTVLFFLTAFFFMFHLTFLGCAHKPPTQKIQGDSVAGLASQYPLDEGIEKDPNVLYTEKFEGRLPDIIKKYSDVKNGSNMALVADSPSGNGQSIQITNNQGETDGGHLYRNFESGSADTIYLRYYVKYPSVSKGYMSHISVRIGGNDPASKWSIGRAGQCGIPDHFNLSYEPVADDGRMDTYLYWPEMKAGGNLCYGNHLITNSGRAKLASFDTWMCVEIMITLNTPGKPDGSFRVWHDGEELGHWQPGSPRGGWNGGRFQHFEGGIPFEGFLWRGKNNPNLKINNIKFEFYDTKSTKGHHNYVQYSNVVIAKKRVGAMKM